jgi:hypothetical protein
MRTRQQPSAAPEGEEVFRRFVRIVMDAQSQAHRNSNSHRGRLFSRATAQGLSRLKTCIRQPELKHELNWRDG